MADITYTIDSLTLVINDNGWLTEIRGSDGVNYAVSRPIAMLDGYTRTPVSAEQIGDELHVYFSDATLHYTVTTNPSWITFSLDSMEGSADTISMLRLRCDMPNTGQVLGAAFNDTLGFCVLADSLGPKVTAYTVPGLPQTDIQAIVNTAGYSVSVMDLQFKDAHAIAHGLDYTSSPSGAFGRDLWTDDYMFMSVSYARRQAALKILQDLHCDTLMLPATCWSSSVGSYPIHAGYFPGGLATLKQTVDYFHDNYISVGMHVWSSKVAATDPLAIPISEKMDYFVKDESGDLLYDSTVKGFIIDQNTSLLGTVADNIANIFNYCGFDMVYFDGLEDVDPSDEHFYSSNCQYQVISRITKRPIYHMGSGAYHGMIHSLARLGTLDIWNGSSPSTRKEHVDRMVTYNQRLSTNGVPGDFGWYFLPVAYDELEYMLGRAKALDIPYSFHANITEIETESENYDEIISLYDDLEISVELRSQMLEPGITYFVVDDDVIFSQELDLDYGVTGWIGEGENGAVAVVWSEDGSEIDLPRHVNSFWADGSSAPKVASDRRLTLKFDTSVDEAIRLLSDFNEVIDQNIPVTPTPSYSAKKYQEQQLSNDRLTRNLPGSRSCIQENLAHKIKTT